MPGSTKVATVVKIIILENLFPRADTKIPSLRGDLRPKYDVHNFKIKGLTEEENAPILNYFYHRQAKLEFTCHIR